MSSRTDLLIKHKVNVENQNYQEVVPSLLYITYHGFVFMTSFCDIIIMKKLTVGVDVWQEQRIVTKFLVAEVVESAEIYHTLSAVCKSETLV